MASNNLSDVKYALIAAWQDAAIFTDEKTAYENVKFEPDGTSYADLMFLPSDSVVSTLGAGGLNDETGILQITFNVPTNTGESEILGYCDEVENYFIAGREFTHNNACVRILSSVRGSSFVDDNYYIIPVSVTWKAKITRNTI